MCSDWRKHIAPVKGCTDMFAKKRVVGNLSRLILPFPFADPTEEAVVRTDEELTGALNYKCSPARADTRIDHRDVNRPGGKIFVAGKQIEGGAFNVLRRNVMSYVNNFNLGIHREDDALHRADEVIVCAEVGQESDDGHQFRVAGFEFRVLGLSKSKL